MKQEAAVLRWIVEQQDRDAESNNSVSTQTVLH